MLDAMNDGLDLMKWRATITMMDRSSTNKNAISLILIEAKTEVLPLLVFYMARSILQLLVAKFEVLPRSS